jgi:hypothetical protein
MLLLLGGMPAPLLTMLGGVLAKLPVVEGMTAPLLAAAKAELSWFAMLLMGAGVAPPVGAGSSTHDHSASSAPNNTTTRSHPNPTTPRQQ